MMFLFAEHSDKPLKSLISMAHEGNHICLHRFSFIYVTNDLREDVYICPINATKHTTKSASCVMELRLWDECLLWAGLNWSASAIRFLQPELLQVHY